MSDKKIHIHAFVFLLFIGLSLNCSTQRNNYINRNVHQISTKYNTLFNGQQALEKELQTKEENYVDNFFQLLPVEKFEAEYKIFLPGTQPKNANLERAEEKAVKAIQKHSMNINNVEENNQIDEAYLLLGKSRYYQKRFLAAKEAFNYVLDNDLKSNIHPVVSLWREKANIRMDNNNEAIRNLKYLTSQKLVPKEIRSEAYAYLAQAQIKTDSLDKAVESLEKASEIAKDKAKKARYKFIAAQLLEKTNRKDSAIVLLRQIEEDKKPRQYKVQAELYRYRLSLDQTEKHPEMLKSLFTKLKRYDFHKLWPYIHYGIAEIYHTEDSLKKAVHHYTAAAKSSDKILKEHAYEKMANIGFYKKDYVMAGAYLDSMLMVIPPNTLKHLKISHKKRNIEDVVSLEKLIQHNDSILSLVQADSLTRVKKIKAFINELKKKEQEKAEAKTKEAGKDYSQVKPSSTHFYFYNNELVARGKENFRKKWGDIPLKDLWRLNNNPGFEEEQEEDVNDTETKAITETKEQIPEKYQVAYYYKQIPSDPKKIDSLYNATTYAHYQAGLIYYDKFLEYEKAKEHLEKMLSSKPRKDLIAPAKYTLYKIYKETGEPMMAQAYANEIYTDYPQSIYADLIKNPGKISERSNEAFRKDYLSLYELYKAQRYDSMLNKIKPLLIKYNFHPELGKMELLRADAIARVDGLDKYHQTLKEIIIKYPKTEYEEEAKRRLQFIDKNYKDLKYKEGEKYSYKILIPYDIFDKKADEFIECLKKTLYKNRLYYYTFSKDPFTRKESFIVIHGFLTPTAAEETAELLQKKSSCKPRNYFVISSSNYKRLQLTKDLEGYKTYINNKKQ